MRTILDSNLLISYLLSRHRTRSAIGAILEAAAAGAFTLLVAPELLAEIARVIAARPDLAGRITSGDVEDLLVTLETIAEELSPLQADAPRVGRDPKDDYLIAQAIVGEADFLVTGDRDLLDLVQIDGVRIVTPPEFLRILRDEGRLPRSSVSG